MFHNGPGDIPLVHLLYQIYTDWHIILLKFPKSQRYVLGDRCSDYLLDALENVLVVAALTEPTTKMEKLYVVSGKLDTLKILVRLAKDCDCIHNDRYQTFESKLHEAGKMLGGWINSCKAKSAQ
ncbi:MAG: four helix bundle protein [Patescibacteria group bacterium]